MALLADICAMIFSDSRRNTKTSEQGAVFVIVAFVIFAILGFAAIIVDGMLFSSSQRQQTAAAQQCALAGLQTYLNMDSSLYSYNARVAQALARANQIASVNQTIGFTSSGSHLGDLDLWLDGCVSNSCDGGDGGDFIPGHWYNADTDVDGDNVFDDPCSGDYPCFIPNTPASADLNAIRIRMRTVNPLRAIFAPVIGQGGITVTGQGTASEVPRFAYFLVDLSSSTVYSSHATTNPSCIDYDTRLNWCEDPGAFGPGYPYLYNDSYSGDLQRLGSIKSLFAVKKLAWSDWPIMACGGYAPPDDATFESLSYKFGYYCGLNDTRGPGAPDPLVPGWVLPQVTELKRFKDDYDLWSSLIKDYNSDPNGAGVPTEFIFDRYSMENSGARAEPLSSILNGVNGAMNAFISRSVAGDKVGILGFDQKINGANAETRVFPLQANLNSYFDNLEKATRTGWGWEGSKPDPVYNFIDKMMFPLPSRSTDIYGALQRAMSDLQNDPASEGAQNFIVLVTDGLPSCLDDTNNTTNCVPNVPGRTDYQVFLDAINLIDTLVIPQLVANKVPLHIVLVSKIVGPHTLNINNPATGTCYLDAEARLDDIDFTDMGTNDEATFNAAVLDEEGAVFYPPNYYFYKWARETGGGFYPIRPIDPDPNDCGGEVHATPTECRRCDLPPPGQKQLYDPNNFTPTQQILQAFLQIMSDSPFRLVDR